MPSLTPHLAMSTAVGAGTWAVTGEPVALPAAVAAGVLPDLDHLLDYYFYWVRRKRRYLIIFLHGWEYLIAGLAVYVFVLQEPWLLGAVLGYATQIGADQLFHGARWDTYLITARAARRFRASVSTTRSFGSSYESHIALLPFGRERVKRWFESRK